MEFLQRLQGKVEEVASHPRFRTVEHLVLAYATYRAVRTAWSLGPRGIMKKTVGVLMETARHVPLVAGVVAAEEQKAISDLERELLGDGDADAFLTIPTQGLEADAIRSKAFALRDAEVAFKTSKAWGGIYHADGTSMC
jgi:hypothetical protein